MALFSLVTTQERLKTQDLWLSTSLDKTARRFVRFVSTPEILEYVYTTIETYILQIGEAIDLQSSNDIGQSTVKNNQWKSLGAYEGGKYVQNVDDDEAIVLYTPGALLPKANRPCSYEENSKVQLLKVLKTRKTAWHKEQGMACTLPTYACD
ncbi:hypothetical protein C2S51_027862 [Perilla frutescens var. frutescens]|nr:hypothetical protein C2S51_027862 [Perilla frutescens var. frutescens]